MIVTLQDVNEMPEALDCENFHDKIIVECDDGFWYCFIDNKASCLDDVVFKSCPEYMVQFMNRCQGKGYGHVNDQLRDAELSRLIQDQKSQMDDRGYGFEDLMPGASSNEYVDVDFGSYISNDGGF